MVMPFQIGCQYHWNVVSVFSCVRLVRFLFPCLPANRSDNRELVPAHMFHIIHMIRTVSWGAIGACLHLLLTHVVRIYFVSCD